MNNVKHGLIPTSNDDETIDFEYRFNQNVGESLGKKSETVVENSASL